MMFCYLQFGMITNKLVLGVSVFGVDIILAIAAIGNKQIDSAKLDFKGLSYHRIGIWILILSPSSPIIFFVEV